MKKQHKYIGLDVHKDQNQVAIADGGTTGEVRMYGSISNDLHALEKLTRTLGGENVVLHFVYEAGPCGFVIARRLAQLKIDCMVVSPSLVPKKSGDRIKTNRRDAVMLARLHRAGELKPIRRRGQSLTIDRMKLQRETRGDNEGQDKQRVNCQRLTLPAERGAFYNPWIFQHTRHYLATGELLPEPTFDERISIMARHLDYMVEVFGENIGCRMFRKVAMEYATRFGPVVEFNRRVVRMSTRAEFEPIVQEYREWRQQFMDENGHLRTQYAPRPLQTSYANDDAMAVRVPKGPNELW